LESLLPYLVVAAIIAAVIAYSWQFHFWSPRSRSPLWLGFSATGMSALFLIAGLVGWDLSKHSRFVTGITRTGDVIWWQIAVGLAILPVAIYLLRRGVRDVAAHDTGQVNRRPATGRAAPRDHRECPAPRRDRDPSRTLRT
jgi:hypothetical protein